ncbi:Tetratricopeptide repeat-containing protein [Lentzea fradiae]|uniref:Tetratricopeptide repeat-containing protein n=1 Tax=Lentzea fradiae TaxID=200378 RepID=A0A1G7K8X7_9PSEU|nr:tetratricopeptide repeat protein [Lentzea fradiae]SDF33606.1 Tetratricopeptide repeat-containing protein [Lentzea fradiae]
MKPLTLFVAMPGSRASLGAHATWTDPDDIRKYFYEPLATRLSSRLGREVELVIEKDRDAAGPIHDTMFEAAMTAEVYLADLTGANPNVYLELGVRWALRDNVTVPVCQDVSQDVKFNVLAGRTIPYGQRPAELEAALDKIIRVIANGLDSGHVDSLVRKGVHMVTLPRQELDDLRREVARLQEARGDDLFTAAMKTHAHQQRTDLLRQVIDVNPGRADAYGELGKALSAAGQEAEAITLLDTATRIDPDRPEWWRELGIAQSHSGDLDAAARSLQKAVDLDSTNAGTYASLGGVYRRKARTTDHQLENLRQARDAYQGASRIDKNDLYPLANLRRLDVLLADTRQSRETALAEFRKLRQLAEYVIATEPTPWRRLDHAETLAFDGDPDAAVAAVRQGLSEFEPEHRRRSARTAMEPLRDMLATGWLPDDVVKGLQALLTEYEAAS